MTRLHTGLFGVAAIAVAVLIWLAVPGTSGPEAPRPSASLGDVPTPGVSAYDQAIDAAHRDGLRVWIEADLVKRWLAGPDAFRQAVAVVAEEATHPGVVGIKITDELGYHDGLGTSAKISDFLHASAVALHAAAPGKKLLIDMIVPELGCLPGYQPPVRWAVICAAHQRGMYPQLALDAVGGYLAARDIDVVDLSTGLLPERTYSGWGIDTVTAQRAAWQEVLRRGWDQFVALQARKALAHPGVDADGPAAVARQLSTFLDIPLDHGATAVDVWTWRQAYQGQMYRLLDPGLRDNALWRGLLVRRAAGARLFTHLSPHSVEVTLGTDLKMLARVFTDVFVAAGTG